MFMATGHANLILRLGKRTTKQASLTFASEAKNKTARRQAPDKQAEN
jgi:hypothetical protein